LAHGQLNVPRGRLHGTGWPSGSACILVNCLMSRHCPRHEECDSFGSPSVDRERAAFFGGQTGLLHPTGDGSSDVARCLGAPHLLHTPTVRSISPEAAAHSGLAGARRVPDLRSIAKRTSSPGNANTVGSSIDQLKELQENLKHKKASNNRQIPLFNKGKGISKNLQRRPHDRPLYFDLRVIHAGGGPVKSRVCEL
jgi:hypothetical protein